MIIPVILSGGVGSRLWPLSRELFPKQFLHIEDDVSLLQSTMLRMSNIRNYPTLKTEMLSPLILCNEEHRFKIAEQLRQLDIKPEAIILEPIGKSTAPAIAIAALYCISNEIDPVMLVSPADHIIKNPECFYKQIENAQQHAENGNIVTFGIVPTKPEIAYGYIAAGECLDSHGYAFRVREFTEKPDILVAEKYLREGGYYWNSGIFMMKASILIEELKKYQPEVLRACEAALKYASYDLDFIRLEKTNFMHCESISIDYGLLECTDRTVVIPSEFGWSDVGCWAELWGVGVSDASGNVIKGDVIVEDVSNSYLHAEKRLLSVIGMENCIVVETEDAVLVADRNQSQKVKNIVNRLKERERIEVTSHKRIYRPWGHYDTISEGEQFKVKRITVYPHSMLSLQKHSHRSEHWVVVKGSAMVVRDDERFELIENQSTYISVGMVHRLENVTDSILEIIEIQTGSYLGEDDIQRIEDIYGRVVA